MKASLLAVAILATLAIAFAVDEECIQRKLRGLNLHWPHPSNCSRFYRCTSKNVKHELLCPAGKEYNPKTGRCAPSDRNECKLSLRAALNETTEAATYEVTTTPWTFVTTPRPTDDIATTPEQDANTPYVPEDCLRSNCDQSKCLGVNDDFDTFPTLNSSSSSQYYCLCWNHEALCRECPEGSQFEEGRGICSTQQESSTPCTVETTTRGTTIASDDDGSYAATSYKCDPSKCKGAVDLFQFPALNANAAYCVCINAQPEYRECADNANYDVTSNVCVTHTAIKTTVSCKGGYEEGEFVPNEDNCMLFYICYEGELLEASCGMGNYYDRQAMHCAHDATGKCAQKQPEKTRRKRSVTKPTCKGGLQAGEIISNPANCSSYYVCSNNELLEVFCNEGYYFSSESHKCDRDINHICWPPCHEGEISANDNTCSTYFVCCNKELREEYCDEGYYFNVQTKKCEEDVNNTCWPVCSNGEVSASNYTCSSYYVCRNLQWKEEFCNAGYYFNSQSKLCEDDINNSCKPRCTEGDIRTNNNTCSSYYECCNNEWKEEFCKTGYYFNSLTNKCEEDTNSTCWPRCTEGDITENDNTCSSYFMCCNNEWKEEFCKEGYYFNSKTKECEEDTSSACWLSCTEGEIRANNNTCSSYYICSNNELREEYCDEGYYFNAHTKKCEEDVNNTCWPVCSNGEVSASNYTCSSYYVCRNHQWKEEFCNAGYYFNSQSKLCEDDINNSCKPRCTEGDMRANNNTCSSYYECCNNEWKEELCKVGYYFNSLTNDCEEDTNSTCWPRCTEGDIRANNNTCSSYYVCCNNEWKEEFCKEGYYFNSLTNECLEDTNYTCWPGCIEGDSRANNNTCSSYFMCCNNEWKEEFCKVGYYFNSQTKECEEDTNSTCWLSCTEGDIRANNNTCSSYYICSNNELREEYCDEGYYFNVQTKKCEEDVNNTCWPVCTNGEVSASNYTCSSYYVCRNHQWKEEFCNAGYYFNSQSKLCEDDTNNSCWTRCIEGDIRANNSTCSSYFVCCNNEWKEEFCRVGYYFNSLTNDCEEDTNVTCWPRCTEGDIRANNNTCSSYYECCNNEWKEEFCKEGYYFNSLTNECLEDTNYTCWPGCIEGDIRANNNTCSSYYECCNNEWKEEFCKEGYYFNSQTKECTEDTNSTCWPRCTDGDITENDNTCSSYFMCCNNEWKQEFCKVGYYFNSQTKECEEDTNSTCWLSCTEGDIRANNNTCSSYYICSNNELREEYCDEGYYFNVQTKKCEEDVNNTCWPVCTNGEVSASNYTCSSYYVCRNHQWKEEFCSAGYYFNSQSKLCEDDTNNTCSSRCTEGDSRANNNTCSTYYKCCNNEWKEEFCKAGYYFNSLSNECEEDTNNTCWPRCIEGEIASNNTTCSSYYVCCNNEWREEFCKEGYYFNSQTNKCEEDTNSTCWTHCTEGDITENDNTCSSYFMCCNNEWKEEFCKEGYYFNPQTKECAEDTNNTCWPRCIEGEIASNNTTCSSYFVCCNNEWKEEFCKEGYFFNSQTKECAEDTNNTCWPRCIEGDIRANNNTCSSYFVCCNNEWREEFCKEGYYFNSQIKECAEDTSNTCWPRCIEGEIAPNNTTCSSYYVCCNNEWKEEFCKEGYFFNSQTEECAEDTNNTCWPRCIEGDISANTTTCSSYYVCCKNEWREEFCKEGYYFNSQTNECKEDTNNTCWPRCIEGEIASNNTTCSSYYVCCNNEWKEEFCKEGYFFNSQTEECAEDTYNTCWPRCIEGDISANTTTCSSYYVCCNNEWREEFCKEGYYFNSQTNECKEDTNNTCWPRCIEGEISEKNTTCSSYYVCCTNEWREKFCKEGYFFNSQTKKCEEDFNNTCWPVCTNGEVSSTEYTCSSYYVCWNNEWREDFCKEGYFYNSQTKECAEDTNNTCWPRCIEGEIASNNTTNCSSYYVCCNNEWQEQFCKEGDYFNSETNACEPDIGNICGDQTTTCIAGEQVPSSTNCSAYLVCCNGAFKEQFCDEGFYFSNASMKCEPDIESSCWVNEACTCTGGYVDGESLASDECDKFYICSDGVLIRQDCGLNNYFNASSGLCELDTEHTCWKNYCADQSNGALIANPKQCNAFYSCHGGESTDVVCAVGDWFDATQSSCQPDVEAVCYNPCANEEKITVLPHPSCEKFYWCNGKHTLVGTCAVGGFNEKIGSCDPRISCSNNECNDKPNYYVYADPDSKNNFYLCKGGVPQLETCPPSTEFNGQMCVRVSNSDCDDTKSCSTNECNDKPDYYVYADPDSKNNFYLCIGGVPKLETCPASTEFNGQVCTLVSNSDCDETICFSSANYVSYPTLNATEDTAFCMCYNGHATKYVCPAEYVFRRDYGRCFKSVPRESVKTARRKRSIDVDEFLCINDEKRSVPSNCSQYELCVNEVWQRRTCTHSRYYNPEQQKCLEPRDDTICAYAKVAMLPACTAEMEQRLHRGRTCQQYFRCQEGKWRLRTCAKSQVYEERLETCLPHGLGDAFDCQLLANATEPMTYMAARQCQHMSVRPYEHSCAMYLMCLESQWWYQYCPLGMYFNRSLNYCIPDNGGECPETVKTTAIIENVEDFVHDKCTNEGLLRPSALACNRYYICIRGQWQQQQCANHEFYDAQHSKCSADTDGVCAQLQMDCLPQEKRTFPLNCSAYEECSSRGKWHRLDCPREQTFDSLLQRCVPNDGICSARGLTRVCNEHEIRAVSLNCTQFYFCAQDNWALGSCLKGYMYWQERNICVPHSEADKCRPLRDRDIQFETHVANETNICEGQEDGTSVAHASDCTRYYICVSQSMSYDLQCSAGSFFDSVLGYCRPNDGTCRLELTGVCANASDESLVAHPSDCQAYYSCSTLNGQQLMYCPEGQYYHKYTRQCRVDHGECKGANNEPGTKLNCSNVSHGTRLAHERYCNVYYACVKGLPIPVECPDHYQFNALLGKCIYDTANQCQDGQLVDGNQTYSCGHLTDGSYIADRKDCTRYYICSDGQAQPKKCSSSAYFDSEQLLCVPDDGSCPYVDDDQPNQHPVPPDPIVCEGKHGFLMPDPMNCNNFYVCINGKLRHERCNPQHFFNTTSNQCQLKQTLNDDIVTEAADTLRLQPQQQCLDEAISVEELCEEYADGASVADQSDCRLYITCQEEDKPMPQRCRNGESYDSLLGFCRQNDGTCLLENGKRAGECSDRHGQMARDTNHCRKYFICINGQKIPQTCQEHEYFSKSQNMCINDTLNTCNADQQPEETGKQALQSCNGLSESILYPYVHDNCRSYFQCVKGVAKVQQCADDLYFDPLAIKCVKDRTECMMPQQTMQRSPILKQQTYEQLCLERELDQPYANTENNCRSYYTCRAKGEVIHELCPLGMAFDGVSNGCVAENKFICK